MDRDELRALLAHHRMNHTWCYGCAANVGRDHIVNLLMPPGVDYLLEARVLNA